VKILYVVDRLGGRGGADNHLLQVIRSAADSGARVSLACGQIDRALELTEVFETVRVRGLAAPVASSARLAGLSEPLCAADVVHVQNVMNPVAIAAAVETGRAVVTVQDHRVFCPGMGKTLPDGSACRESMSPEVCPVCLPDRDYRDRTLDLTRARREALDGARLVVLSRYMAEQLQREGLPGVEILPPWLEVGPQRDDAGDGLLIGGRLVGHKGVHDGYMAWRRADTGLPLRVAGDGPLAGDLTGAERLGWLSQGQLRNELRRARGLLFPSVWQEPFGILALQALAEGTPVIVTDVGGTADWSDAGCIRVSPGDVGAMAEALQRLADDPGGAMDLGRRGREMVADRFSRAMIEPRLDALYAAIAAARG
jgi:glycosyltransferase involved in cell wall biosynthesis